MSGKLIELSTEKLLAKFGAGDHKPGSGSAAALQGMLSAKLLLTVIELTADQKRAHTYADSLPELEKISVEIGNRIFPALENIFQEDSDQFDKTIHLRKSRDNERDPLKRKYLAAAALEELREATELPIKIANHCVELAQFAAVVFEKGFRSARGDAGVAQNGAIAAVAGCLAIINLNLLSFPKSPWKEDSQKRADAMQIQYTEILAASAKTGNTLRQEVLAGNKFYEDVDVFLKSIIEESKLTDALIEKTARGLQNVLWRHKERIWKIKEPKSAIDALSPEKALRSILGYEFYKEDTLGSFYSGTGVMEVAGIIDPANKTVIISRAFPKETQNFTAAHELGHALFHRGQSLHRDKPLDGSATVRDKKEQQADKFAAYFLLPEKQVKRVFQDLFGSEELVINEQTVFALTSGSLQSFRKKHEGLRESARLVAGTTYFGGQSFRSIAEIFNVSVETMAIRIEELHLLQI